MINLFRLDLLIGSISEGVSTVKNVLESEDVFSTISCLKKLGIEIQNLGGKHIRFTEKDYGHINV